MFNKNYAFLCFLLLVYCIKQDAFADKEDKSDEMEDQDIKHHLEGNSSLESSGPPDSHEAMNNRDLSSKQSKGNREKRSYEFLMGLVNNNSRFEVTNVDLPTPNNRKKNLISNNQALLELMIKIASDPEQWEKVHRLLQKIDNDLLTSKKLFDSIQNSIEDIDNFSSISRYVKNEVNTTKQDVENVTIARNNANTTEHSDNSKINDDKIQKMVVILNDKKQKPSTAHIDEALKSNRWPDFQSEGKVVYKPNSDNSRYQWQSGLNSESKTYPRNFAYHRVTGNPLYHSNFDKNPKAYIAVSVIAPKPLHSRSQEEDLILENELRQLKPWTKKQNHNSMREINTRWLENVNAP